VPESSFHESFSHALQNASVDSSPLLNPSRYGDQRRRFDVYRNNRVMSLIEALCSTYPTINQLVGDEFFKASATAFINANPPSQPVMAEYGKNFGRFISSLPNTGNLPFLKDIAELEWQRLQAYHCVDSPVLSPAALAEIPPHSLTELRIHCHPALSCIVSKWPIGSILAFCADGSSADPEAHKNVDMSTGEAVVITRPRLEVRINKVDQAAALFLNALRNEETLGYSAEVALEYDNNFNAGEHLTGLLALGAFSQIINI